MILSWSSYADKSRDEQIQFIAEDNPSAALRQEILIGRRIQMLKLFPKTGVFDPETNTFRLVIPGTPYIAWYRIRADRIEIFRFRHGRQEPL